MLSLTFSFHGEASETLLKLQIVGPIGPAKTEYVEDGFRQARLSNAKAIILEVDTLGGLEDSINQIIQEILTSSIPVITYVSPKGAQANGGGAYILYASHIAAMSPGTTLSITPSSESMESLAKTQGGNGKWPAQSILKGQNLWAQEALQKRVIDFMAKDLETLLLQAHGREVSLQNSKTTLDLKEAQMIDFSPDWWIQFLEIMTTPNVLYILMLIGIYGLMLEFIYPGAFVPGLIGGICLILAFYFLYILPINYAGLGLMLLGVCFMIGEAFIPSLGILGMGGLIAFILGSVFLIEEGTPAYEISWILIGLMSFISLLFFTVTLALVLKSRKRALASGKESLVGQRAYVQSWKKGKGYVWLMGESWEAEGPHTLDFNSSVIVKEIKGLKVNVRKETL